AAAPGRRARRLPGTAACAGSTPSAAPPRPPSAPRPEPYHIYVNVVPGHGRNRHVPCQASGVATRTNPLQFRVLLARTATSGAWHRTCLVSTRLLGLRGAFAAVAVLEPDDVVQVRCRDLEDPRVVHGGDAVDGAGREVERLARRDDHLVEERVAL